MKTVEESSGGDQTSHEAIKPTKMNALIAKVASANKAMDDGRQRKSELIADAVENDHLHKLAFSWFMKLRKMDPVKRNEARFHFDVYCEREWGKNEDLLTITGEQDNEAAGTPPGESDVRPRHLRQPGASAAAPSSSASARVRELADKAEANLSKIGRGPNAAH